MIQTEQIEQPDLLAALQRELERARAELAQARAGRTAKRAQTVAAKAARLPFRKGDRVRITAGSDRWNGKTGTVEVVDGAMGEVKVLGAWFTPAELTKLPRTTKT